MVSTGKMLAFINALGGGSGPSEVVILPETELTPTSVSEDVGRYNLFAPPENAPTAGAKCKLIWGGMEYTNTVVDVSAIMGAPMLLLGNTDLFAEDGMSLDNPNADAPYCVVLTPDGIPFGEGDKVAYGEIMSMGITPDPPVLSIVQVGAASGGGGGASAMIVNIDPSTMTIDKPFSDVHAAVSTGKTVHFLLKDSSKTSWFYPSECTENEIVAFYIYFNDGGILQAGGLKISSDGKVAPIGS